MNLRIFEEERGACADWTSYVIKEKRLPTPYLWKIRDAGNLAGRDRIAMNAQILKG